MKDLAQTMILENVYLLEYINVTWNSKKQMKIVEKNINHQISSSEVTDVKYVHILLGII